MESVLYRLPPFFCVESSLGGGGSHAGCCCYCCHVCVFVVSLSSSLMNCLAVVLFLLLPAPFFLCGLFSLEALWVGLIAGGLGAPAVHVPFSLAEIAGHFSVAELCGMPANAALAA